MKFKEKAEKLFVEASEEYLTMVVLSCLLTIIIVGIVLFSVFPQIMTALLVFSPVAGVVKMLYDILKQK